MEYNVSTKVNGKWFTFGKIKTNQYGNQQLSFKKTKEFVDFIAASGDWINFSLFAPKDDAAPKQETKPTYDTDSEIPF